MLLAASALLLFLSEISAASKIPLPRPRPAAASAAPEPAKPLRFEAFVPEEPSACEKRLAQIATIQSLQPLAATNGCGALDAVRLEAIILPDKARVALTPPAILRCPMAEEVAHWIREDVVAAVSALGTTLLGIDNYDSFDCRGRNRVVGAKLSEHGRANALDLRGFLLANKVTAGLTDPAFSRKFREDMRKAACARFTTVLGPGSDGYHESHIHLDLAERRGGYRMCQWDIRDPAPEIPLPRPRPAMVGQAAE